MKTELIRLRFCVATTLCLFFGSLAGAGDLTFRRHVISSGSEYSAVAVLDVNRDGRQDILCGGFWYEAPGWERHFVRNVERIRGRFDGYSHLPMDVNADGWTDVITVNYRSRSIRWIEHPGADFGPWSIHSAAEPGAMETGRLFDIDGDGQLDILPNGQQFAAWWSVTRGPTPQWKRHELPIEVAGHGMGFGDINGDGRGDVIGPRGWASAPKNQGPPRWIWHREFDLGRASVPVLVVDVDGDGDNDLVWCRAHGFGVYWLEQTTSGGTRTWTHHTIDTSWSQCHSPLWADMDGDGKHELIAGKRYMAHEGRDPGAYDPLVSYRYQFNAATWTWQRWPLSTGENVGFGLDPKTVDLDADGDLDLVVSGRSGLYWLENEGPIDDREPNLSPSYDVAADLTIVKNATGRHSPIKTPFDWGLRRSHLIASIEKSLGNLPSPVDRVPLDLKVLREHRDDEVAVQSVSFQATAQRRVDAQMWLPQADHARMPGLIVLRSDAKADPESSSSDAVSPRALAKRGYVCVVPKWNGRDTLRARVWGCIRAADLLESMAVVNADRLGCVGLDEHGQMALFTSALDQRIKATLCTGEDAARNATFQADAGASLSELVAAMAPRSLCFDLRSSAEARVVRDAVERSLPVFGLYPTAQQPTIYHNTALDHRAETHQHGYAWLHTQLKRGRR